MKKALLSIALLAVIGFTSCKSEKKEEKPAIQTEEVVVEETVSEEMAVAYYCPMKCEGDKTYSEKGSCPQCKMDLVEVEHENDEMHNMHDKDSVAE